MDTERPSWRLFITVAMGPSLSDDLLNYSGPPAAIMLTAGLPVNRPPQHRCRWFREAAREL
jgi:hypothetical protein